MRIQVPASRANLDVRFAPLDIVVAAISPYLALDLRNALVLTDDAAMVLVYCLVSFVFSLIAFAVFRIQGAVPRYLSADDIVNLAKAVLLAELMTSVVLFTVTRLNGVPRSVPAIQALILGAGLLAVRGFVWFRDRHQEKREVGGPGLVEHVILIGLNDLSVFLIKFLAASAAHRQNVIALLDPEPRLVGRSVQGVRVFGPPTHLEALIEEFATHGVHTDRVLVSDETGRLLPRELRQISEICGRRGLPLMHIQDVLGKSAIRRGNPRATDAAAYLGAMRPQIATSPYFFSKGRIEFVATLGLLLVLWPLWLAAATLALFDVGSPTLFWQRRVGLHGRSFQLYKIRTLRAAFDRNGRKTPEEDRLSRVGRLLRQSRLDELPQLVNVLAGDMALIGPRPLLPNDQPADPSMRLAVRPGITGWAQVNGGALLSPEEKHELDAWYIRHATFWLDLKIVAMTFVSFFRGDLRSDHALAEARAEDGFFPATRPAAIEAAPPVDIEAAAPSPRFS